MPRLANSRVISRIEQIINRRPAHQQERKWTIGDVECAVDRHRHTGSIYSFSLTIVRLRHIVAGKPRWFLALVTERWWIGEPDDVVRDTKWIKLINGDAGDVLRWIKQHEDDATAAH